jgi:hypothetical protein
MADARARAGKRGTADREPAVCPVALCPIGLALTTGRRVQPEAVDHLLAAARELLLAVQVVLEARTAETTAGRPLERIEIA